MASGQPRGCRRQIYERLSPRQVRRGSKHRARAALGAAGGSARTAPRPSHPSHGCAPLPPPAAFLPAGDARSSPRVVVVLLLLFSALRVIFRGASHTSAPSRVLHRGCGPGRQPPRTPRRGERGPRRPGPALRGAPGPAAAEPPRGLPPSPGREMPQVFSITARS